MFTTRKMQRPWYLCLSGVVGIVQALLMETRKDQTRKTSLVSKGCSIRLTVEKNRDWKEYQPPQEKHIWSTLKDSRATEIPEPLLEFVWKCLLKEQETFSGNWLFHGSIHSLFCQGLFPFIQKMRRDLRKMLLKRKKMLLKYFPLGKKKEKGTVPFAC